MAFVNAIYTWTTIKALNATVLSMSLAGIVALVFTLVWAVRLEKGFGDHFNLIAPGNGHVWSAAIIAAVVVSAPAHCLGLKLTLQPRLDPGRSHLEEITGEEPVADTDGHETNRLLFLHAVICLLSGIVVAILNAACFVRQSSFQEKTRDGLIEAIENYGADEGSKSRVDAVQAEFQCCGAESYRDWFRVPWTRMAVDGAEDEEEDAAQVEGQSEDTKERTSADVPFSCCSNRIVKPCVHHDILKPSAVYDYDPRFLTISTVGCRPKIFERSETIRYYSIGYFTLLSVYQVVLSLFSRLLQTAHSNALYLGPEKSRYHVWIFCRTFRAEERLLDSEKRKGARNQGEGETGNMRNSEERFALHSGFETSDSEKTIPPFARRKRRSSEAKLLRKLRWRVNFTKSKSVPLLKSPGVSLNRSVQLVKKSAVKRKSEARLNEEDFIGSRNWNLHELESVGPLKSDATKDTSPAYFSRGTSIVALPPPPPPPPPLIDFQIGEQFPKIPLYNAREEDEKQELERRNRMKVLEKFGNVDTEIQEEFQGISRKNSFKEVQRIGTKCKGQFKRTSEKYLKYRETGGADDLRKWNRLELDSNVYNRFRGTLQHTLARREALRIARTANAVTGVSVSREKNTTSEKRNDVLAKLQCKDVPPSFRILADSEIRREGFVESCIVSHHSATFPPPPPARNRGGFYRKPIGRRHCSVCNRPVQGTSSTSTHIGSTEEESSYSFSPRKGEPSLDPGGRSRRLQEDYSS